MFGDDFIDLLELKMTEVQRFEMTPHPLEFVMYYSADPVPERAGPQPERNAPAFSRHEALRF